MPAITWFIFVTSRQRATPGWPWWLSWRLHKTCTPARLALHAFLRITEVFVDLADGTDEAPILRSSDVVLQTHDLFPRTRRTAQLDEDRDVLVEKTNVLLYWPET